MKRVCRALVTLSLLLVATTALAQDLDPRAYVRAPVKATFYIAGFSFSSGGVVTDTSSVIQGAHMKVEAPSIGVGRSFSFFGKSAQAFAGLPYAWAQGSAAVGGQPTNITRAGLADARLRLAVLFHGAPAATLAEIAKAPRRTILGASLTVVAPTGQNSPLRLVNIGSARWAFKPELAVSAPVRERWLVDVYLGLWLFTNNSQFYPGSTRRTQAPMGALQAHISYMIRPLMWAAFDATYYAGGLSALNGVSQNDRQSNSRIGGTLVMPVGRRHSIKLAVSSGAIIRFGSNFTTFSVGWQTAIVPRPAQRPTTP